MKLAMLTFEGDNLREGMGIEAMSSFMLETARANPGATLDDLKGRVLVNWPARVGPGSITIEHAGKPHETIKVKHKGKKPLVLSVPVETVVRLAPESPDYQGARLLASPNGEVINQAPGASGGLDELVKASPHEKGSLEEAYTQWLSTGEVGVSSKALASALCFSLNRLDAQGSHPRDWSDFGRCVKMLDAIPQLRSRLGAMYDISPAWSLIYRSFEHLEKAYRGPADQRPDFDKAVLADLPSRDDRIMEIGQDRIEIHQIREDEAGGAPGTRNLSGWTGADLPGGSAEMLEHELDEKIRHHLGALSFEPTQSPRRKPSP